VQKLDKYLTLLQQQSGSDLYLTVGLPPCLRINKQLLNADAQICNAEQLSELVNEILNLEQLKQWRTQKQTDFAYTTASGERFRGNAYQQRGYPALVFRSIVADIPPMEKLNLPPVLAELVLKNQGLILFVGSTGVGKSTSMASMIDYRNQAVPGHIITIEDPIEFVYQHKKSIISQREVGTDSDSLSSALKSVLRQAPGMIQIGEIRSIETMQAVLQYSETGHLVISTLHANSANEAVERIVNFFPKDIQHKILADLSSNLLAIVAQRMLQDVDGKPIVAFEVMLATPRIAELIKEHNISAVKEVMQKSGTPGMFTFDDDLFRLQQAGKISEAEALHHADSANDLEIKIKLTKGETDTSDLKMR
jgi:twitching motility protein PilU